MDSMIAWRIGWLARVVAIAIAAAGVHGCATNPVTGKSELTLISESDEIGLGARNYGPGQQAAGGRYVLDPALSTYVSGVGQKLASVSDRPQLPYEFVVLNDSVPNAWAMPGGKIAINRGLLLELRSEAELAAVLGHEIVHAAARHGAQSMETGLLLQTGVAVIGAAAADRRGGDLIGMAASVGAGLIGLKYGRDKELEADRYGMTYMARAGYDPQAAVALQETFVRLSKDRKSNWLEGLFASHPPSQERVEENRRLAQTLPRGLRVGEPEYRERIATLARTKEAYALLDEGRKALEKDDAAKAIAAANRAIGIEPREALFYGLRGDARLKRGERAEAERDYDEAIRRNGEYYQFHLNRGVLRRQAGNRAGARADLERSLALLPTSVAHYALGSLEIDQGDQRRGLEHLRAAAGADDEAGRRSGELLARIELPREPARYLAAGGALDGSGRLVVIVQNRSRVTVRDVAVGIRAGGRFDTVRLGGSIQPGGTVRTTLDWRPADFRIDPRTIELRVESARIAD